jgi:hypothetical protein
MSIDGTINFPSVLAFDLFNLHNDSSGNSIQIFYYFMYVSIRYLFASFISKHSSFYFKLFFDGTAKSMDERLVILAF